MLCRWCHFPSTTDCCRKRGQHIRYNRFAMWFSCAPVIIFRTLEELHCLTVPCCTGRKHGHTFVCASESINSHYCMSLFTLFLRIAGFPSLKVGWVYPEYNELIDHGTYGGPLVITQEGSDFERLSRVRFPKKGNVHQCSKESLEPRKKKHVSHGHSPAVGDQSLFNDGNFIFCWGGNVPMFSPFRWRNVRYPLIFFSSTKPFPNELVFSSFWNSGGYARGVSIWIENMNKDPNYIFVKTRKLLGGDFKHFLFSPRKLGNMNPFWLIFFKWVETTNQISVTVSRMWLTPNCYQLFFPGDIKNSKA